jgi:sugar lactone lactonase YvrE
MAFAPHQIIGTPARGSRRGCRALRRGRISLCLEQLEDRVTPSTLIPVPNRRDLVYDGFRGLLYMTTSAGALQRYDVQAQQLLSPFAVGASPEGADITPDGQYLYVTEGQVGATQGFVRKVNLDDGTVTNLAYSLRGAERGSWDLAVAGNGQVFFTTDYSGSGASVPLHQIDLATDTLSTRMDVSPRGLLSRGADESLLFGVEPTASTGPIFTYDAAADAFQGRDIGGFNNSLTAVSRDGSLFAMVYQGGLSVMDRDFHTVQILGGVTGGMAFDPNYDTLYAASPVTNEMIAFDTHTWQERYRVPVGETVAPGTPFDRGEMVVSNDSAELFLSTAPGVRVIDLPPVTGQAARLDVTGFPSFISAGTSGTFTVTVKDPAGYAIPDFTGTVHFSSTDPNAQLPDVYTFTPADQGAHTFSASFLSNGTYSLTATDDADGLSGSQTNIQVHTASVSLIPVSHRQDLIWDAARGLLYITTSDGSLQRYDPATQTLLAPFQVGASPEGADITLDGHYLYVTESQQGATQGFVRKVNLDDGTVTNLTYAYRGAEKGSWDLAVAADGLAFFTTDYSGSGAANPLHQIDLTTDALSTRMDVSPRGLLSRGADASLLFGIEPTASTGPIFTYDAAADAFQQREIGGFNNSLSAVNRNGSLFAIVYQGGLTVMDRGFNTVQILGGAGVAFDPNADILYAASNTSNQVIAYDTNSWRELYRVDIGESLSFTGPFGNGEMQVSDDSTRLFVSTPTGVRVLDLSPMGPRGRGTPAISPFARDGSLDTPANQPGGLATLVWTPLEVTSSVRNDSLVTKDSQRPFSAGVDLPLPAPTQDGKTAAASGIPSGRHSDLPDDLNALLAHDWTLIVEGQP